MFDLSIVIDLVVVGSCVALLFRFGRLSHSHPATIYIFFHLYTFTSRLLALIFGAPTLFDNREWGPFYLTVTGEEIIRAAALADIALIVMTWAWIKASTDDLKRASKISDKEKAQPNLSFNYIAVVAGFALPLGLISLLAFSYIPSVENIDLSLGDWESSSWITILQTWVGLSLLAFIYWSGFKWHLVLPMGIYLGIMSLQGYHRFRVILPMLLMLQIYLDRHKLRWPSLRICGALVVLFFVFFPLKSIGQMVRIGSDFKLIVNTSSDIVEEVVVGRAGDQQFLDQFATSLTLIDENGTFYYGKPYLALLTLPIPRIMWPEKPRLTSFMEDFSRPWRPMHEMGMIITFLGDAYANFGYLGIIVISALMSYIMARFYFSAYRSNYFSVLRFAYLMVAVNLIQVYRDGLLSIVIFTCVNMMPLTLIVMLNYFFPKKKLRQRVVYPRWQLD